MDWEGDISDGAVEWPGQDRAASPNEKAAAEDALYRAIQDTASGRDAGKEEFVRLGEELSRRVAGHLLRRYPGLLDPAMADPHAPVEEVAEVILDAWYEALFGDGTGWRLVRAPAAGGRPSAYLWEIAKHHLLRREDDPRESLESRREAIDEAVARSYVHRGGSEPRAPGLREEDAWEYVRQTDSLSQCADSIAQEVLDEDYYPVFHQRIWGCGDEGKRMTYREIGERQGISEEAARKRFDRGEGRILKYVRDHPEDPRVQELKGVIWVDGLRVLE